MDNGLKYTIVSFYVLFTIFCIHVHLVSLLIYANNLWMGRHCIKWQGRVILVS